MEGLHDVLRAVRGRRHNDLYAVCRGFAGGFFENPDFLNGRLAIHFGIMMSMQSSHNLARSSAQR